MCFNDKCYSLHASASTTGDVVLKFPSETERRTHRGEQVFLKEKSPL